MNSRHYCIVTANGVRGFRTKNVEHMATSQNDLSNGTFPFTIFCFPQWNLVNPLFELVEVWRFCVDYFRQI
jgi:hypothetical protein